MEEQKTEQASEPDSLIQKANLAAERLEKANEMMEANLRALQAVAVEKQLGGRTSAGAQRQETEDERITREAREYVESAGISFDDTKD